MEFDAIFEDFGLLHDLDFVEELAEGVAFAILFFITGISFYFADK